MSRRLILATGNLGKVRELRHLLPPGIEIVTAASLAIELPEETGETFAANAALKALAVSRHCLDLVLADDSGLEVDALGGRPGVRSARYAGEPGDDRANNAHLLRELARTPVDDRSARFRCALCLARGGAVLAVSDGMVEGMIAQRPKGSSGFGYDPLFRLPDGRTMAELEPVEKNAISHRARAFDAILPTLISLLTDADSTPRADPHP